jgi:hypothetical protein
MEPIEATQHWNAGLANFIRGFNPGIATFFTFGTDSNTLLASPTWRTHFSYGRRKTTQNGFAENVPL